MFFYKYEFFFTLAPSFSLQQLFFGNIYSLQTFLLPLFFFYKRGVFLYYLFSTNEWRFSFRRMKSWTHLKRSSSTQTTTVCIFHSFGFVDKVWFLKNFLLVDPCLRRIQSSQWYVFFHFFLFSWQSYHF